MRTQPKNQTYNIETRLFMAILIPLLVLTVFSTAPRAETIQDLVDSKVEEISTQFKFTEGPVWHPDGYLLFSDIPNNKIMKWEEKTGKITAFRDPSGKSNGLTLDLRNRLLAVEHWNRRVSQTSRNGQTKSLTETYKGKKFNSPNDIVVHSNGDIYFTDPEYGLEKREKEQPHQGVYRLGKDGKVALLAASFTAPNGLAFSPDEKVLYVADSKEGYINAYDVAADGTLKNERKFCEVAGPDGMKVDEKGRLFTTSREGITVYLPDGTKVGAIAIPQKPANCAFGGADRKTLFVTARTGLYKVRVKTPGCKVGKR